MPLRGVLVVEGSSAKPLRTSAPSVYGGAAVMSVSGVTGGFAASRRVTRGGSKDRRARGIATSEGERRELQISRDEARESRSPLPTRSLYVASTGIECDYIRHY